MYFARPSKFGECFFERLAARLPVERQEKLASFRNDRARNESALGWGLLLYALKADFSVEVLPEIRYNPLGKPAFSAFPCAFNISHTDDLVCLSLSTNAAVGVDAQVFVTPSDAMVRRVLTENEQNIFQKSNDKAKCFTMFWTQKEALVKCTGEGISRGLQTLDFSAHIGEERFYFAKLHFLSFSLGNAAVTVCGEEAPNGLLREITPEAFENVLKISTSC